MSVSAVDNQNFQKEVLDHKGVVFVDFYADWCGPCKMTEPIVEEIAEEEKEVKFVKLNVDQNQQLAQRYSIFSIPTFMIFKNGQVAGQFTGARDKQGFINEIKKTTS